MRYSIEDTTLINIANAIREKTSNTDTIQVANMADEIGNIKVDTGISKLGQYFSKTLTELSAEDFGNLTEISSSFENNYYLTKVTIPDTITTLGTNAFNMAAYLENLTIPASVTFIGTYALGIGFYANETVTLTFLGTTPPTLSTIGGLWCVYGEKGQYSAMPIDKIIVPNGCADAYKSATNWSSFADIIEEATE